MAQTVRHRARGATTASGDAQPPRIRRRPARFALRTEKNEDIRVYKQLQSQQLEDPFFDHYGAVADVSGLTLVEPPYNFGSLMRQTRDNNMLRQCVDSMVTNVEGHGWRLEYVGPEGQETSDQALSERVVLENLLDHPNPDHGLQELRARLRRDYEVLGNAYVEIGRDRNGRVVLVAHVPAHTVRLTNKEREPVEVTVDMPREGAPAQQRVRRHFRRYVQLVGHRKVYFKEFGDPRTVDWRTGQVQEGLGLEQSATELLHLKMYSPGTPYGMPRWINQLPAIFGSHQAEMTNLDFFRENAIPALALLVGGGTVTQETLDDIEAHFMAQRGRESFNRILVIEAKGDEDAANQSGAVPIPRMELKPLQNERQRDALFQEYDKNNMRKVRSSFRMPPIFVGLSDDYSHATAKASFEVAESQVFGPERARSDDMWNNHILASYGPRFWSFRSLPPRISDPGDIVNAIDTFDTVGALTPNVAIGLANDFFDLEVPQVEASWGDLPFRAVEALLTLGVLPEGFDELLDSLPPAPGRGGAQPPAGEDEGGGTEEPGGPEDGQQEEGADRKVVLLRAVDRLRRARVSAPVTRTTHSLAPSKSRLHGRRRR